MPLASLISSSSRGRCAPGLDAPAYQSGTWLSSETCFLPTVRLMCPAGSSLQLNDTVYPVCHTWPMGFSWSSYVAQSKLLGVCKKAGISTEAILADSTPLPRDLESTFALATDDAMFSTTGDDEAELARLRKFDRSLEDAGILGNKDKDVSCKHRPLVSELTSARACSWHLMSQSLRRCWLALLSFSTNRTLRSHL